MFGLRFAYSFSYTTNFMRKSILPVLFLFLAGFATNAQSLLSEGFEGSTFPPTGWSTSGTGTNYGSYPNTWMQTQSGNGYGSPTPSAHGGSYTANYDSYWIGGGGFSDLITPALNFSSTGNKVLSFWTYNYNSGYYTDSLVVYLNTSASVTGATLIAAMAPTNASSTGWTQYTYTLPSSFTGTTNYIIFRGVSDFGYDLFLDDVDVVNYPPCTGKPNAGTASASATLACASTPLTLTATGYTIGSSMTTKWQSSPAAANTWSDITGATTPVYTMTGGITSATDFRFIIICNASTQSDTSNTVSVTMNSYLNCYCIPTATYGCQAQDEFDTLGITGIAGTAIAQRILCPTGNIGGYMNYSSLTPLKLVQAMTVSGSIAAGTGGDRTAIWIDFNNDGNYASTEKVWFTNTSLAVYPSTTPLSFVVPATAPLGSHRMRIRLLYNMQGSTMDPCIEPSYSFGEARDFSIEILSSTPPPPTIVTNAPICPGGTVTFTLTDTSGYPNPTFNLSGPATGGTPQSNTTGNFSFPSATTAFAGTYSATLTSGGYTSNPTTLAVTMYSQANLVTGAVTATSTCLTSDGTVLLTGLVPNAMYNVMYQVGGTGPFTSKASGITASAAGTYMVTGLAAMNYAFYVVNAGTNAGGCTSNTVTATVPTPTVPPTPVVTYAQPLCPNTTLQLSVTNPNSSKGATYSWYSTPATGWNSGSFTGPNATRDTMNSSKNGQYCTQVTVNGCVSVAGCVTVTTSPKDPKPTVTSPQVYCQFSSAIPLTASGTSLTWFGPWAYTALAQLPPGAPNIDSSRIPRASITPRTDLATGTNQGFVYGVVQNQTCPSDTAYVIVQVTPKPGLPTVPPSALEFCQYEIAGSLSAGGQNIRWYATPTGGLGTATAPTPSTQVPGTYYFYVSQTVNGCEGDRATIVVNVKPKPAPPKVTSPQNLCEGDPLAPLTAIGQNLLWYSAASGGVGVSVAPIPNTGYEDSFQYWVTQTVNGCESDRAMIAVFVNYKPNGVIVAASPSVCEDANDTFFYYGNARPDAQYIWSSPIIRSTIISGGTDQGPFIVHFDSSGTAVIHLQINNKGCISTLISAPITVRHLPKFDFNVKRDVCRDELVNISLLNTEPNITTYSYDFGSSDTTMVYAAPPGGPFGIRYHTPGDYMVSATATLDGCTSKPYSKRITVHDLPDAQITALKFDNNHNLVSFDPNSDVLCSSDTLVLSVRPVPEGGLYTWTPAAFFQSLEDSLNFSVRAVVNRSAYVKVNVKSAFGCEANDSILVNTKPCCGVYFPNVFSPNAKNPVNRTFKPITAGFHIINNFRIINRWGQVVYETKVEKAGWDGTYNGVPQDMGVYYWYISYLCEGKNMEEQGEVTLIR